VTTVSIDTGAATRLDAKHTLEVMKLRVRQQLAAPAVWQTARNLVARVTPRDEVAQARAIRAWALSKWRFINDPLWHQLLETPLSILEQIRTKGFAQGNCADAAMLTAALCEAIHLPCRFVAVAFNEKTAPYSHVFTIAYPRQPTGGRMPVEMDITRPATATHVVFSRRLLLEV